jgi:predicted DsbA family dithiol-disulfide isomerase
MPVTVGRGVNLDFYSSAFCDPCILTRAVLREVRDLVPAAVIREFDVARDEDLAREHNIRSTPTIIVRSDSGDEVFRAAGIPSLNQVLVALAKAV